MDGAIDDLDSSLVRDLHSGISEGEMREEIAENYSEYTTEDGDVAVEAFTDDLLNAGYDVTTELVGDERMYFLSHAEDQTYRWQRDDGSYRFAVISDTHLGSEGEQLDSLEDFYDEVVDRDIDVVFHAGDISDGCELYRGHKQHKIPEAIGWGRLIDYVADNYPKREGVDTLFLEGNHDHQMWKSAGIRLGEEIEERRDDLHYLSDSYATIDLGEIDIDLVHPAGGAPYTLGYRAQTWLRDKPEEAKADITVFGHLHQVLQAETEGSHAFYAGAWQGQTPYLDRKGHKAKAGGWILDLDVEDGDVSRLQTEFIEYPLEEDTEFSADDINNMLEE